MDDEGISTSSSSSSCLFIREALIRAARSCSNIIDFENEQYFIHWSLDLNCDNYSLYKFHDIYLKMDRFFREFTGRAFDSDQENYADFRRRVRQYDQNRIKIEIQRRKYEQQKQQIWYIVHPFKSNKLLNQIKQDFQRFWLQCCNYYDKSYLNQKFQIKFICRSNYPLNTKY